nr:hypothetical protein [Brevibacterium permense]
MTAADRTPPIGDGRSAHPDRTLSVFGNLVHRVPSESIEQPGLYRAETPPPVPDEIDRNQPIGEWIGIEAKFDEFAGSDLRKNELARQGRRPEA